MYKPIAAHSELVSASISPSSFMYLEDTTYDITQVISHHDVTLECIKYFNEHGSFSIQLTMATRNSSLGLTLKRYS